MIKIAIDLSTTNTGVAVLNEKNTTLSTFNLAFEKFSQDNLFTNINKIKAVVYHIKKRWPDEPNIWGIEVSNFINPSLTNKFNFYAGILVAYIKEFFGNTIIKIFNSNEWQNIIGAKTSHTREERKRLSREFTKENCEDYDDTFTEDICDAYCIAYFLTSLKTTEDKHKEVEFRKRKTQKDKSNKLKYQTMINVRLEKINSLDNKKNKRKIDRLKKEIEELKEKM